MTTPSDKALANALHCEAKKHAYRQTQDGVVVSFVIHPQEVPEGLATASLGTRYMIALVEIGDDELPVEKAAPIKTSISFDKIESEKVPEKERMTWQELQPSAQAAIRCNEPVFWAFLREDYSQQVNDADEAATAVRKLCDVNTRAAFNTNSRARAKWENLDQSFGAWKMSEQHT